MDNFEIPELVLDQKETDFAETTERKKMFGFVQFDCLPNHVGIAAAFKNYWVYCYDKLPKP